MIPIEILEDCWNSSIKFFKQSESEKIKVGMPFPGYTMDSSQWNKKLFLAQKEKVFHQIKSQKVQRYCDRFDYDGYALELFWFLEI